MAEAPTEESLTVARIAVVLLSENCCDPRTVEANMDILSTALANLGIVKLSKRRRITPGLCEVLQEFISKKHLNPIVVRCCRGIEELIQVSDYDISDFDTFEEEVRGEIEVLQQELENYLHSL